MTLGETIKNIREKKGLSRNQMSKKLKISESTLFKIETGSIKNPSFENVKEIALALEIDLNDLI